jgi:hypothetical protein
MAVATSASGSIVSQNAAAPSGGGHRRAHRVATTATSPAFVRTPP